eukprot:3538336-Prymnesium_polylepis.1
MQKTDGTRATTPEENAAVFASHFEKLYGHAASFDPTVLELLPSRETTPDLDHAPTDADIRRAVQRLNNTAPPASRACLLSSSRRSPRPAPVSTSCVRWCSASERRVRCPTSGRRGFWPSYPRRATSVRLATTAAS